MIEYTLAKQLKDAGFPQIYVNSRDAYMKGFKYPLSILRKAQYENGQIVNYYEEICTIPTLSELIEACTTQYKTHYFRQKLSRIDDNNYDFVLNETSIGWEAGFNQGDLGEEYLSPEGIGTSMEEAVANLWLELNKK